MSLPSFYFHDDEVTMDGVYTDECLRTDFENIDVSVTSDMLPGHYQPLGTPVRHLQLDSSHTESESSPVTPRALTTVIVPLSPDNQENLPSKRVSEDSGFGSGYQSTSSSTYGQIEHESISLPARPTPLRQPFGNLTNSPAGNFLRKRRTTSHDECHKLSPPQTALTTFGVVDETSPISRCPKRRKASNTTTTLHRAASTRVEPTSFIHHDENDPAFCASTSKAQPAPRLQRSFSENNVQDEPSEPDHFQDCNLIGDGTMKNELEIIKRPKRNGMVVPCISGNELSKLLSSNLPTLPSGTPYLMVDCRYPYEFAGGNVRGSVNVMRPDDMVKSLFGSDAIVPKNTALIFFCEFSQKRGPRMAQAVRQADRHRHDYPSLRYPQMYIVESGYRGFFKEHSEHCNGGYISMFAPEFRESMNSIESQLKHSSNAQQKQQKLAPIRPRNGRRGIVLK